MSFNLNENVSTSIKSRYRPEIDGLRAFAVVAVIINHFNKEMLPNGYLGVDIFFVISGFVITSSLYQRPSRNFRNFISGFYARRIKRLVPALSVFVLITSIAICLFNPEPILFLRTGLTSLFGLSNLYLLKQSTDYFAQSTEPNVFTHTWSLGVEEQFYILFPFLIWFSGFGRQTKNGARNLFLMVGALTISSLIGFVYLYPFNQPAAYFLMPTRFWEMGSGCLIFIGFQKRASIKKCLEKIPSFLVLALIIGVMYMPISMAPGSTIAVVILSSVLIASLKQKTRTFAFFTHPKVVYLGLISYSLYLWHWSVLSISRWTIGVHWWSLPFQFGLMLGLGIVSYRYIEMPLRNQKWFGKKWKIFVVGGGVIIIVSNVLLMLEKTLNGKLYTGNKIQTAQPKFLQGEKCLANVSKRTKCFFIDNKSSHTLWLLGDSHAQYLAPAGEGVADSIGMNLKSYFAPATTFPPIRKYRKTRKFIDLQAIDDFGFVEKELYRQIKFGDIILLSLRMPLHFGGTYNELPTSTFIFNKKDGSFRSQEGYFNDWISAVVNLANISEKQGAKVIIQTPTPEWEQEKAKFCSITNIQWFNRLQKRKCQIKSKVFIDEKTGIYNHLFEKLNKLSSFHKNIYLLNTYKIVCPRNTCSYNMNGADIYFDENHISYKWARDFLSPKISKFIKELRSKNEYYKNF